MKDFIFGMMIGAILTLILIWYAFETNDDTLQIEYTAYRHCMQDGYRCQMTPEDFVRYYELRAILSEPGGEN